jgi:hypothetical protein
VATTALSNGWYVTTFPPPPARFDIAKTRWPEVGIPRIPPGSRAHQRCSELVQHARFVEPRLTPLDRKRRKLSRCCPPIFPRQRPVRRWHWVIGTAGSCFLRRWHSRRRRDRVDKGNVEHPQATPAEAGAPRGTTYGFEPGTLYVVDANAVICNDLSPFSGAHSDIRHPEILWAVISAAGWHSERTAPPLGRGLQCTCPATSVR